MTSLSGRIKINTKELEKKALKFRKEALKVIAVNIGVAIKNQIKIGKSPVKGFGSFAKYSSSYISQIKMQKAFMSTKRGGLIVLEKLSKKELMSYRASKQAIQHNEEMGDLIRFLNKPLLDNNKKRSPVNLKVTGDLINSFKAKILPDRVRIRFDNEKFVYHNNEGVGKSKIKRRMLPTESGEKFNLAIMTTLKESLTFLIQKIFKA
jgi:hypothetical protein